jgi:hypothetical protein
MLQISDFTELHVLVDSLLTMKFDLDCSDPDVRMFAGSPILASVLHKAYAAEIEVARSNLNEIAARKREDRQIISSREDFVVQAILSHLSYSVESWRTWDISTKKGLVETLASPFLLSDDICAYLLVETDRRASET